MTYNKKETTDVTPFRLSVKTESQSWNDIKAVWSRNIIRTLTE